MRCMLSFKGNWLWEKAHGVLTARGGESRTGVVKLQPCHAALNLNKDSILCGF